MMCEGVAYRNPQQHVRKMLARVRPPPAKRLRSNSVTSTSSSTSETDSEVEESIARLTEFATWLENQQVANRDAVLRAVERDGGKFLKLARATIAFENALLGEESQSTDDGVEPLVKHARTLQAFSQLLDSKFSEDSLTEELKEAVSRDAKDLLRLAKRCRNFDRAIGGLDDP